MPTTLLIMYRVLGTVLFALAAAAIVEKYRTVRGATLLPARVLECRRASSTSNSRGAGGYRYLVELYANGRRLELETNDAFWFRHDKDKGAQKLGDGIFCGGAGRDRRGAAADPVRCL